MVYYQAALGSGKDSEFNFRRLHQSCCLVKSSRERLYLVWAEKESMERSLDGLSELNSQPTQYLELWLTHPGLQGPLNDLAKSSFQISLLLLVGTFLPWVLKPWTKQNPEPQSDESRFFRCITECANEVLIPVSTLIPRIRCPGRGETAVLVMSETPAALTRFATATVHSSFEKQLLLGMGYLITLVNLMSINLVVSISPWSILLGWRNVRSPNRMVLNPVYTKKSSHIYVCLYVYMYINIYIYFFEVPLCSGSKQ